MKQGGVGGLSWKKTKFGIFNAQMIIAYQKHSENYNSFPSSMLFAVSSGEESLNL